MNNDTQKLFNQLVTSDKMGGRIDKLVQDMTLKRKRHERRWFDNMFFDDGYHFRYVSNKTGRIIDYASKDFVSQERAIPRASRQIRGISNLLYAAEPYPVVYPHRITMTEFPDTQQYQAAVDEAKKIAQRQGTWLSTVWSDDNYDLDIIEMILLASKTSISYLKLWGDDKQKIHKATRDGFDIYVQGEKKSLDELTEMIEAVPMTLPEIQNNPLFDEERLKDLKPDNKYASSEIKEAYMRVRYGMKSGEADPTILVKEAFMKEALSDQNWDLALKLGEKNGALEGKSRGDMIMRHSFSAGGITLRDEYVDLDTFPYAEFRFEPGPLYQVPLIERFIPQNKSEDIIMTRLEKWVNAQVVGIYQKRKGENYQISNAAGGQMIEYETTPLQQMQNTTVGGTPFQVLQLLDKYIDEQGASTSALNQLPQGVKSGVAIESVKSTEYANLKIPTKMLKNTIKQVASRMFEIVDKQWVNPEPTYHMDDGEPDYFDVMGQKGIDARKAVKVAIPEGIVPISKDLKVRIEIEPGLGLTMEGKKQSMQEIINFMLELMKLNMMPQEAMQQIVKKFLEIFGFGSTEEFMEAFTNGQPMDMNDQQIQQMKIAIAETMKDVGAVGPEADQKMVDSTKVGVAEAMKDLGMVTPQKKEQSGKVSINYKDLPPIGQTQAAAQAGIQIPVQHAQAQQDKQDSFQLQKLNKPAGGGTE